MFRLPSASRALSAGTTLLASLALAACSSLPEIPRIDTFESAQSSSAALRLDGQGTDSATGGTVAAKALAANAQASYVTDSEWDATTAHVVTFSGVQATTSAPGVTTTHDTTTITSAGVYRLTGSYTGQIIIDAPKDAQVVLVLNALTVDTTAGAAIDARTVDDLVIHLQGMNSIADASSYADSATANAAIYADANITISGSGSLSVNGRGNDAIAASDNLTILSGNLDITATDDGLRGKDSLTIAGGALSISAHGDALKADQDSDDTRGYIHIAGGTLEATAGDDAITAATDVIFSGGKVSVAANSNAIHADVSVILDGADITVAQSTEGIEGALVHMASGRVSVVSSDDGLNGSSDTIQPEVVISGGELTIDASGDGLDSNGSLTITGGTTIVWGPVDDGNGAVDADGQISMTGGTMLAVGSAGMAMTPSTDGLGWLSVPLEASEGSEVTVTDDNGQVLTTFTTKKTFQNLLYVSDAITFGNTYSVTSGGSTSSVTAGEARANIVPGGPGVHGGGGPAPR